MITALLVGLTVSMVNVILHTLALVVLRHTFERRHTLTENLHEVLHLAITITTVTSVLMAAHCVEIALWAVLYDVLGLTTDLHHALYAAMVSYTSAGHTLPQTSPWRLLDPLSTVNGLLLVGLSTAAMFNTLNRATENYRARRAAK